MLTLKQISEISFRKSNFSGYKPEDVDDFIDEVTESFTALLKENQTAKAKIAELTEKNTEYKEKMVLLAQKVEQYKKDEEGIKDALLSAQKLGNQSVKEAKKKGDAILADANKKADSIMNDINNKQKKMVDEYEKQIEEKKKELDSLKALVTDFRTNLFGMYRDHLKQIENLPDYTEELKAKKVEAPKLSVKPAPVAPTPVEEDPIPLPDELPSEDDIKLYSVDDVKAPSADDHADLGNTGAISFDESDLPDENFDSVDGINLNAYADIPESLRKEKESLYSTLEFGDGIHLN